MLGSLIHREDLLRAGWAHRSVPRRRAHEVWSPLPLKRVMVRPSSCAMQIVLIRCDDFDELVIQRLFFGKRLAFRGRLSSASSLLRPRREVTLQQRGLPRASFSTFCFMMGSISVPTITGCAAPVLVPGAMAATSPASRMKKPAEAPRAPAGATQVITGTWEAMMRWVISRIDSMSPPGVSRRSTTAASLSLAACSRACATISTVTGAITPLICRRSERGDEKRARRCLLARV